MDNHGSNDEQLWEEHDYDGRGRPRPSAQICANCGECGNEGHGEDKADHRYALQLCAVCRLRRECRRCKRRLPDVCFDGLQQVTCQVMKITL